MAKRKSRLTSMKLDQWIKNNLNVLFIGKHGVGKTSIIKEAFDRHGLRWLYFSGATLDPWVDFIGIPREKTDENGQSFIELVRPKEIAFDEVDAIFLDEYNRCLTGDTKIKLANGLSVPVKDLEGKDCFYVYAYDHKSEKIVIAKGHSARKTKKNAKLVKVKLDNGQEIRCTPDHPFLMRDGVFKNASDLKRNDSLMPLYTRLSDIRKANNYRLIGYEEIFQPNFKEWDLTHRLSSDYNLKNGKYEKFKCCVIHHIDKNKLNNDPENLELLNWTEHKILHKEDSSKGGKKAHEIHKDLYERTIGNKESKKKALKNSINTRKKSKKYKKIRSDLSKHFFSNIENKNKQSKRCQKDWQEGQFNFDQKEAYKKRCKTITFKYGLKMFKSDNFTEEDWDKSMKNNPNYIRGTLSSLKIKEYFNSFDNFKKELFANNNHKVVSVEYIDDTEDVYDITVDDYHNFALDSGIFVHNCHKKIRNAIMELIQFKSINGKKLKNLKLVWAAVNPENTEEDDDLSYDVEKTDPAQKDRFQIHIELPYEPSKEYFAKKYNPELAAQVCTWWHEQADNVKNLISPRRLDYAVEHYNINGDVNDVLPEGANVSRFTSLIVNTPVVNKLKNLIKNKDNDGITELLSDEDKFNQCRAYVTSKNKVYSVCVPLMPDEKISELVSTNSAILTWALNNIKNHDRIQNVLQDIADADVNHELASRINKHLKNSNKSVVDDAIKAQIINNNSKYTTNGSHNSEGILAAIKVIRNNQNFTSVERKNALVNITKHIGAKMTHQEALQVLDILDEIASHTHINMYDKDGYDSFIRIVNACVKNLNNDNLPKFEVKYPFINKAIIDKLSDQFYYKIGD